MKAELGTKKVASFDIFDTVLTRRVGNPRAAFLLLGRRLCKQGRIACSPHAFAVARTDAEIRTFSNSGGLDSSVSLADIYHELGNALHLPQAQIAVLIDEELRLESELLVRMSDGAERVQRARDIGQQIVYVSDMYLSSEFLEATLRKNGLFLDGDKLIVSNERKQSKATGKLWSSVVNELGTSIHHVGNDVRSDGSRARRAGITTTVVDENNLNRYEKALEEHAVATDGLSSSLAGASRLARLDPSDPSRRAISDVAAGVVAPFVIGNLLWTLEVAKKEGLTELFFVARDGQLLCDVARELAPKIGYEGKLTYAYGSRQAWALAGITADHYDCFLPLIPDSGDVSASLRTVLSRLNLTPEEIEQPLIRNGFNRDRWDQTLSPDEPAKLRSLLQNDELVIDCISMKAKCARELVLGYLEQIGAITDQPIGFVDLGTGATLFNSLSAILGTVGQQPPLGFYFGLRPNLPRTGYGKPLTYVRNEEEHVGFLRTPGLLTMVELACTADHGSVLGYCEVDGQIEPVLAEPVNVEVVAWGLPVVREAVVRVARELLLDPELVGSEAIDLRPAIMDVFELFWTSPTREEAEVWGAYPFEDGWGEFSSSRPIAEPQKVRDSIKPLPHRHWWQDGANELSGPVSRTAFESRRAITELRNRVKGRLG